MLPGGDLKVASKKGSDTAYHVMLVDDSAVIRGLMTRLLEAEPDIVISASVGNGRQALEALDRHDIEVIILDIEMPVMDGMTALPLLLKKRPDVKILISSTLTAKNAAISLKALSMGASDYLTKPQAAGLRSADEFKRDVVAKIKALGQLVRSGGRGAVVAKPTPSAPGKAAPGDLYPKSKIVLRKAPIERPAVLAIGSSTGGPQALFNFFELLDKRLNAPILITQHMPPTFTRILAERLGAVTGLPAGEGIDGEPVVRDHIYVAPGDHHMTVVDQGGVPTIKITNGPPENFCRPAVDPMLRGVAEVYGRKVLVVILTGMGSDGALGSQVVVDGNGSVVAQDEATSVVWGMPGAAATSGVCSAVLPLSEIAPYVLRRFGAR